MWVRKLEGTKSDAVIVMHPGHATEISKRLQLPSSNIIMADKPYERKQKGVVGVAEQRRMAEPETARIEKARLERKKRKAIERMKRIPQKRRR